MRLHIYCYLLMVLPQPRCLPPKMCDMLLRIIAVIIFQKAARRRKAVKVSTTISEEDKSRYLGAIQACYMSSDDSASDSEAEEGEQRGDNEAEETTVKRKKFLTKKLPWRSTELEDLVKSLDRKSSRRRSSKAAAMMTRRESSENASERLAPQDAPQWAIRLPPLTT